MKAMRPPERKLCRIILLALPLVLILGLAIINYLHPRPAFFRNAEANRDILIAHAGGGLDGLHYTNSRQALEAAIAAGFKFIELDLLLTCDGHLAAVHDWAHFRKISGGPESEACLDLADFKSRTIHGRLGVLGAGEINEIFSRHPGLYLVTDKIRDFEALTGQLNLPAERLLVEVFSYKDYVKALRKGLYPMLSIGSAKRFRQYRGRFFFDRIAMIAIPQTLIPELEKELADLRDKGVVIFAFTANDSDYVKKYINRSVTGFYTDDLRPSAVQ